MENTMESEEKLIIADITNKIDCQSQENTLENNDLMTPIATSIVTITDSTITTTPAATATATATTPPEPFKYTSRGGPMPFVCTECPRRYFKTQKTLDLHVEQHKTGTYICQICSKECKNQAALAAHLNVHSEDRPYACTFCNLRFKNLGGLKSHVKLHANLKFTCPVCGKEFKDLNNCKWHEKKHSGDYRRTYNCKICDKSFIVKCLLNYHMRTHTGERPNVCEHCGAAFADKSNLQKHYRIHTGERPFKCEQCGKAFSQKSSLTCHRRSHVTFKPHICTVCNKAFGLNEELIVHLRVHGEHHMFKCNICDKEFREHCFLKSHQRIHSHVQQKARKEWIYNENINLDDVSLYLRDGETEIEALARQDSKDLVKKEREANVFRVKRIRKTNKLPSEQKITTKIKIKKDPGDNLPKIRRKKKITETTTTKTTTSFVTVEKKSRTKRKIIKEIPSYNENDDSDYNGGVGNDHFGDDGGDDGGGGGFSTDNDDEYIPEVNISVSNVQKSIKTNTTDDNKWDNLMIEPIKIENVTKNEDNSVDNENKQDIVGRLIGTVYNDDNNIERVDVDEDVKFENNHQQKRYDDQFADMEGMIVKVEYDADEFGENNTPNSSSLNEFKNKRQCNADIDIKILTPIVLLEQIDPEILKKYSKSMVIDQCSSSSSIIPKKRINKSKDQNTNRLKQDRKKPDRKKSLLPKSKELSTTKSVKMEIKSEIKEELLTNEQLKSNNDDLMENKELLLTQEMQEMIKTGYNNGDVDLVEKPPVTIKKRRNKLIKSIRKLSDRGNKKFPKSYICKFCPNGYTTPYKLAIHSINHLDTFICGTCNLNCLTANGLREHMKANKKCHPKTHKLYNCTMCERHYLTRYDLAQHMTKHYDFKRFICDICDKRFNRKCEIAKHMRRHMGVKQIKCELCVRMFWSLAELRMHGVAHSKETPFQCEICKKTFKTDGRLKNHKRIHNGDLYKCLYCGKGFNVLGNLQIHELRHSGAAKSHQCTLCPKSFLFKHKLTYHMRVHTGERPFACTNCDARFADKSNLVKHYRIHSGIKPYKCGICDKLFNQLSSLNSHKKSHITYKPFICPYCGKSFPTDADLIIHLRIHGEIRKFKCNFCDNEYDELCHMKSHRRLHTDVAHVSDDRIISVEYEKWDRMRKMELSVSGGSIGIPLTDATMPAIPDDSLFPTTLVKNAATNNEVFIITDLTNTTTTQHSTEHINTNHLTEHIH